MALGEAVKLTWGGDLTSGDETWQCGLHLAIDEAGSHLPIRPDAAWLNALKTTLSDYHSSTNTMIFSAVRLMWMKVAIVGPDGDYLADAVEVPVSPFVLGADTFTPTKGAPQVAACITLWTGTKVGKGNYGRYYLPWCNLGLAASGRMDTGTVSNLLTESYTWLNKVNAQGALLTPGAHVVVRAATGNKKVTTVRVGDVKDTQRRRRNQLAENYQALALL